MKLKNVKGVNKMKYYIDVRTMTLTSEENLSEHLAPELFYEYCCGPHDIVIEKYRVKQGFIDFSHLYGSDKYIVAKEREFHFKKHNCDLGLAMLVKYSVPKRIYDEVLKECGYLDCP